MSAATENVNGELGHLLAAMLKVLQTPQLSWKIMRFVAYSQCLEIGRAAAAA